MLMHPQIDPIAIRLGPLAVHWYGLTYLVAFGLFFRRNVVACLLIEFELLFGHRNTLLFSNYLLRRNYRIR